jgi:hypothetical protein
MMSMRSANLSPFGRFQGKCIKTVTGMQINNPAGHTKSSYFAEKQRWDY